VIEALCQKSVRWHTVLLARRRYSQCRLPLNTLRQIGDNEMKNAHVATVFIACAIAAPFASAQTAISKADSDRLVAIAQANIAEIATGKLAVEKSTNSDIKQFAQMMIDDHSKGLADTQKLAAAKNITLPTEPDDAHKQIAAELKQLSGSAFDKAYVSKAGVQDHVKVHAALKNDIANAKDADVKALATKLEPIVAHHEAMAKKLDAAAR
jgi:putative membrane protein